MEHLVSDLDDVWTYTSKFMDPYFERSLAVLHAQLDNQESSRLDTLFMTIHSQALTEPGICVRPDRWQIVLERLARDYPHIVGNLTQGALAIFSRMYTDLPPLREDALASIRDLSLIGLPLTIFSHSDHRVTLNKVRGLGLEPYCRRIISADPGRPKDTRAWKKLIIDQLKSKPELIIATGDSKNSDIFPAYEAGIPAFQLIWINAPEAPPYTKEGILPPGTHTITLLPELPPKVKEILGL